MKRLLLVLATGFGLDGCASLTQKADENYITKSPVTPVNTTFNGTKVLEHGIFTEQDIADMPEHSSINSRYKISF
ncbi:hypothetical protein OHW01_04335 [Acinetobacter baumannii]|uniref:hypothetical protein n=1 Tax=Acinetobacter baumannii TaxID=470 RepID=UPI00215C9247|nr:hypothetical protein [Acinetobacter baumannii]MCR8953905.1 hypothetical protein [Acinetobacter baumannii]MDC4873876.1 hypothetical protein [Acinetobacter baumannii]MDC4885695.1 hypothetical protein [Acinetobacter baumannii]MDC4924678.1 hypothetical protein [Acinetobacter baumannii]MDC4939170.1 hypothetical protein [Acinetobacter baumannii]